MRAFGLAFMMVCGVFRAVSHAADSDLILGVGAPTMQFVQRWEELSPDERGQAYRNYYRYRKLPPERRRTVDENYDRWRQLPHNEKERIRANYQRYRRLSPSEKERFRREYEALKGGR